MSTRTLSDGTRIQAADRVIDAEVRRAERKLRGEPVMSYKDAYNAGWASSRRCGSLDNCEYRFSLRPDVDGDAMDAWMDGWLDYATCREKWHLRDCEAHHNDEGGCGVA